ncbi:hypothetical protein B2K_39180 [Paenibacillus mucilaginosus K02]|uniref:Uncharacterized protein n=1 Tax=Paenibacillus mucilaginosus K02 TaxID=997761 RepID=R9UPT8_9BACL|nr:hypothetical protein B2K_39180 [Paenibacillus mucilaginosus K02]
MEIPEPARPGFVFAACGRAALMEIAELRFVMLSAGRANP